MDKIKNDIVTTPDELRDLVKGGYFFNFCIAFALNKGYRNAIKEKQKVEFNVGDYLIKFVHAKMCFEITHKTYFARIMHAYYTEVVYIGDNEEEVINDLLVELEKQLSQESQEKKFVITKEQCQLTIDHHKNVCSQCGGKLEPIETVDNSGIPTHWVGCKSCDRFDTGVKQPIRAVALSLVTERNHTIYPHQAPADKKQYDAWLKYQIGSMSKLVEEVIFLYYGLLPPVSGTALLNELLKRGNEKNENLQPVIRNIEDEIGGITSYIRHDAMIYELNRLNKERHNGK